MDCWKTLLEDIPHARFVAFDIETVPLASALATPYPADERQPPANYKTAEAIANWRQRDELAWRATLAKEAALSPRTGRIVAIGASTGDVTSALCGADEAALLAAARDVLSAHALVTFNGLHFDVPFVLTRAAMHGVSMKGTEPRALLRRYVTQPHCDLRMVLGNWDQRARGSLADWLAAFGLPAKTGSGADVAARWDAGATDEIAAYCAEDARLTGRLYERVREAFDL